MKRKGDIKGWRERAGLPPAFKVFYATAVERAMMDEIAELRERLGMPEAPAPERDHRQLALIADPDP